MLIHDYFYYFFQIAAAALKSLPGIVAVLLLIVGLLALVFYRPGDNWRKFLPAAGLGILATCIFLVAFYKVVYEYEQPKTRLTELKENADDQDCGTAWTPWITSGIGLMNPCGKGCYRGLTTRQQMRMVGFFPPWPENRREFQCWDRQGPGFVINRGQDSIY